MTVMYRVINCDQHRSRLQQFQKRAKRAGMPHITRQPCVNGKAFTRSTLCRMVQQGTVSRQAELTPIEVAICLSHRRCWQAFLRSKAEHLVVFEDDTRIKRNLGQLLPALLAQPFDVLWMYNGNWENTRTKRRRMGSVQGLALYREMVPYTAGAVAYCLRRDFAQELLRQQLPLRHAVDYFMGRVQLRKRVHLSLDTIPDKRSSSRCYTISPVLWTNCPYEGSAAHSTQNYADKTVKQKRCPPRAGGGEILDTNNPEWKEWYDQTFSNEKDIGPLPFINSSEEDHLSGLADETKKWYIEKFAPEECPLTRILLSTHDDDTQNSSQADEIKAIIQELQEKGLLDKSYDTWLKRMIDNCPLTREDSRDPPPPIARSSPTRSNKSQWRTILSKFPAGTVMKLLPPILKLTADNAATTSVDIDMTDNPFNS